MLEIICVLGILATLTIIALPRYVNLIESAKIKAIQYTLGVGCSNVTTAYSKEILLNSKPPSMNHLHEKLNEKNAGYTPIGVFTVEYTMNGDTGIKVMVTGSSIFEMPATGGPFEKTIILVSEERNGEAPP